ncbi:hypothetical protein D3C87_1310950 [compost metagenome]
MTDPNELSRGPMLCVHLGATQPGTSGQICRSHFQARKCICELRYPLGAVWPIVRTKLLSTRAYVTRTIACIMRFQAAVQDLYSRWLKRRQ